MTQKFRVGKVRTVSEKILEERDPDSIHTQAHCNNCRHKRIILVLTTNSHSTMRACTNKDCFLYTNISRLQTWRPLNQN